MILSAIELHNIRCVTSMALDTSANITLLIGKNNSGKSTLLRAALIFQSESGISTNNWTRIGHDRGHIQLRFNKKVLMDKTVDRVVAQFGPSDVSAWQCYRADGGQSSFSQIPNVEPHAIFIPFLSKRNRAEVGHQISEDIGRKITGTYDNLASKIDRILYLPEDPMTLRYFAICHELLGFPIRLKQTGPGKTPGHIIDRSRGIDISQMGSGTAQILGMISEILLQEDRIFIIEEPENDLHPLALRLLIDLIIDRSKANQFIISSHSNIVLQMIGAQEDAKIYKLNSNLVDKIPTTVATPISTEEDRLSLLEFLGYYQSDYGLWDGWIIFEESSAEYLFRTVIIPQVMGSNSNRVRTVSCKSCSDVENRFRAINYQFTTVHLTPICKNKCLIIIDGGAEENTITEKLKTIYSKHGWEENCFRNLCRHNIEDYYPGTFKAEVLAIETCSDFNKRSKAKGDLVRKVVDWYQESPTNQDEARALWAELFGHIEHLASKLKK